MMRARLQYTLTPGQQNAVIGVLSAIGLVAVYGWAVRPHVASLHAAQQYAWATSLRLDLGESINEDITAEQRKLGAMDAERVAFSEMAFSPDEAVQFHNDLQALCQETKCSVVSLGYGSDENIARQGAQEVVSAMVVRSATLTVDAPYNNVVKLLESLSSRRRKVWIDSFKMTTPSPKSDCVVCEMTVTICVDLAKQEDTP